MKQTVLVIGASGEIGRAIVMELSQYSYQFILHYHQNKEVIDLLSKQLNEDQLLMTLKADLSADELDETIMSIPFQVDIIIFAQGKASYGLVTDMMIDELDQLYKIHLRSTVSITKNYLPQMLNRHDGKIIVISSIWGEIGASQEVYYSAVKGAQISFVKALAKELGHSSVRVNAVSPGFIQTKMNEHLTLEEKQDYLKNVPLKRWGTPIDVAKTVLFLCQKDARYVHGQVIRVNGGQLT